MFLPTFNNLSWSVLMILLSMSVLTWYLIIQKSLQLWVTHKHSNTFLKMFWQAESLQEVIVYVNQKNLEAPFSSLTRQGINASFHYGQLASRNVGRICSHSEFLTRHLRRALAEETRRLDSGLTILATVASTAPFVGLLGTVLGIYEALMTISMQGNASLETVAAPVGEALIMTAFGLAVAIPAVLGYNGLVRGNRHLLSQLEGFAQDLHTCLNTGARLDMKSRLHIENSKKSLGKD